MEAERKQLLTSAELGDKKHAQMWLGTFYEQGRFGKTDFQEALKWSRKPPRRATQMLRSALDKCTKMERECNRTTLGR
jgi:TPR repeat protein